MRLILFMALLISPFVAAKNDANIISEKCSNDLMFLSEFLTENDAGAADHISIKGNDYYHNELMVAREKAKNITSWDECYKLVGSYLNVWRPTHLYANLLETKMSDGEPAPLGSKLNEARIPTLEKLSSSTVLLTVPSFHFVYKKHLDSLLTKNNEMLSGTDNWIIDLRNNNGGSDTTYYELLNRIMVNQFNLVGVQYLVTEANVKAQSALCGLIMPGDKGCEEMLTPIVERMDNAAVGSFVSADDSTPDSVYYSEEPDENVTPPNKVAILIDEPCGSSCEQFLLAAKQSFNVKLVGRRTAGALDYSNLRPKVLPSGRIEIHYAITKSHRLPYLPVDAVGVLPDVYFPLPINSDEYRAEVMTVKQWLETGIMSK